MCGLFKGANEVQNYFTRLLPLYPGFLYITVVERGDTSCAHLPTHVLRIFEFEVLFTSINPTKLKKPHASSSIANVLLLMCRCGLLFLVNMLPTNKTPHLLTPTCASLYALILEARCHSFASFVQGPWFRFANEDRACIQGSAFTLVSPVHCRCTNWVGGVGSGQGTNRELKNIKTCLHGPPLT